MCYEMSQIFSFNVSSQRNVYNFKYLSYLQLESFYFKVIFSIRKIMFYYFCPAKIPKKYHSLNLGKMHLEREWGVLPKIRLNIFFPIFFRHDPAGGASWLTNSVIWVSNPFFSYWVAISLALYYITNLTSHILI